MRGMVSSINIRSHISCHFPGSQQNCAATVCGQPRRKCHKSHCSPMSLTRLQRVTHSITACRVVLHIREQKDVQSLLSSGQVTGPLRFAPAAQRTGPILTSVNEEYDT